jgi:hypothetical protein
MFGRMKRRVARNVNHLARTGQATIGAALLRHYSLNSAVGDSGDDIARRGAAAANFLNGQPLHATHDDLDLPQIYAEARQWMRDNRTMRELVVQTLRVASRIESKEEDAPSEERALILAEFGSEFAEEPHPETYEALVRRAIGTLPHSPQVQLLRFMETGD